MPDFFPTLVYSLCFGTSAICAGLLIRSYIRTRTDLLLWSAACFVLLAANNFVVIVDILILPERDFRLFRLALSLAAVMVLLFGFVWNSWRDQA